MEEEYEYYGSEAGEGEEETVLPPPVKHTSKQRFQRYLDKTGVSACILRGIVSLFEEENKPNDPIRFLCEHWGFGVPEIDEVDALQAEVIQLRKRYESLTEENERFNLLTLPEPTPAEVMGLDEETQELLRKQEEQLTLIQRREACILKAYKEAKVKAAKDLKVPVCVPIKTDGEAETGPSVSEPKVSPQMTAIDEMEDEGEESAIETPELKCSLDLLDADVYSVQSALHGDMTITIPIDELKNYQRYTCDMNVLK